MNNIVSHCYKILQKKRKKKEKKDPQRYWQHKEESTKMPPWETFSTSVEVRLRIVCSSNNVHSVITKKFIITAARLVLGRKRRDSATAALRELHWLKVECKIIFKTILFLGGPFWARTQSKSRFWIIYLGQTTGLVNWFLLDKYGSSKRTQDTIHQISSHPRFIIYKKSLFKLGISLFTWNNDNNVWDHPVFCWSVWRLRFIFWKI